jgi:hypothetical protein
MKPQWLGAKIPELVLQDSTFFGQMRNSDGSWIESLTYCKIDAYFTKTRSYGFGIHLAFTRIE